MASQIVTRVSIHFVPELTCRSRDTLRETPQYFYGPTAKFDEKKLWYVVAGSHYLDDYLPL